MRSATSLPSVSLLFLLLDRGRPGKASSRPSVSNHLDPCFDLQLPLALPLFLSCSTINGERLPRGTQRMQLLSMWSTPIRMRAPLLLLSQMLAA